MCFSKNDRRIFGIVQNIFILLFEQNEDYNW